MQSPFSPFRVISCDDLLARLLAELAPLAPCPVPLAQLRHGTIAAALPGPQAGLPPAPLALRRGYALRSDELIGAGPLSPVMLLTEPPLLEAGEPLPEGADSILDPAALRHSGAFYEISAETFPGDGVLPSAHHLPPHAPLLQEGEEIGPARLLLLAMAGTTEVPCRIPRLAITGGDAYARQSLCALAQSFGASLTDGPADIHLHLAQTAPSGGGWLCQGVALNGVQEIAVAQIGTCVTLRFAPRPELLMLVALGVMLPLLDHLSCRRALKGPALPLSRKISSPVGMSEIVLLRREADTWAPLPSGELSLAGMSRAEALLRIPAGEEGWPAGHTLAPDLFGRRL